MAKRVTLKQISDRVGVSPVAVSAALGMLSKDTQVRIAPDKVEKIRRVAREMGYHRNKLARAFRSKRTHTVGVLFRVVSNPAPVSYLIDCIHRELDGRGYRAFLSPYHARFDLLVDSIRDLVAWQVDGLIVTYLFAHDDKEQKWGPLEEWLAKIEMPVVMVESTLATQGGIPRIAVDLPAASGAAAQHAIAAGHRRLAYVSEVGGAHTLRWAAIEQVAKNTSGATARWVQFDPTQTTTPMLGAVQGATRAARELATLPDRPTVVLCGNDATAAAVVGELQQMGVRVPQDIAIIGYDNSEYALLAQPALTTMQAPMEQVATASVDALLSLIDGKEPDPLVRRFESQLIERASFAAPLEKP